MKNQIDFLMMNSYSIPLAASTRLPAQGAMLSNLMCLGKVLIQIKVLGSSV